MKWTTETPVLATGQCGPIWLVVTRHLFHEGSREYQAWGVGSPSFCGTTVDLKLVKGATLEQAKAAALAYVRQWAQEILRDAE